jgi:hypothetical protein
LLGVSRAIVPEIVPEILYETPQHTQLPDEQRQFLAPPADRESGHPHFENSGIPPILPDKSLKY